MLILRYKKKKVETNMDPIFEPPVFDLARGKMKRQPEKSQEPPENSVYTSFKCGSNNVFYIAKQVRSADEGITVFNKCRDCNKKWRD